MSESRTSMVVWCEGELWCPATATASLLGKKWHPVILQCLFKNGPLGFAALQERIEGISSKVLSESLEQLEEKELIEREIVSDRPFRVEYSPTERGDDQKPIIEAMREWGTEYLLSELEEENSRVERTPPERNQVGS